MGARRLLVAATAAAAGLARDVSAQCADDAAWRFNGLDCAGFVGAAGPGDGSCAEAWASGTAGDGAAATAYAACQVTCGNAEACELVDRCGCPAGTGWSITTGRGCCKPGSFTQAIEEVGCQAARGNSDCTRGAPPPPIRPMPPPPQPGPLPAGFAEAYTLSGCADPAHCGTFRRVAARCTSGYYCPGGGGEGSGSTDRSLCHGAPVYQKGGGDGPVLHRVEYSNGGTGWAVRDGSVLETCSGSSAYLHSADNLQAGGGPPTTPVYSTGTNEHGGTGWVDNDTSPRCSSGCGIAVVAVELAVAPPPPTPPPPSITEDGVEDLPASSGSGGGTAAVFIGIILGCMLGPLVSKQCTIERNKGAIFYCFPNDFRSILH